jgi:hypothetical protein
MVPRSPSSRLGVMRHDQLIVGRSGHASLKSTGLTDG